MGFKIIFYICHGLVVKELDTEMSHEFHTHTGYGSIVKLRHFHSPQFDSVYLAVNEYSRTPLIRPPSESHWCGRIRGMVAREGFIYEQKPLSVTGNVVV